MHLGNQRREKVRTSRVLAHQRAERSCLRLSALSWFLASIVGGYLMEHGNLMVLIQPAELLIIGGAAAGTVLIANPLHILKQIAGGVAGVFGSSKFTKQVYLDSLKTI